MMVGLTRTEMESLKKNMEGELTNARIELEAANQENNTKRVEASHVSG